jgi:hypothetical protein
MVKSSSSSTAFTLVGTTTRKVVATMAVPKKSLREEGNCVGDSGTDHANVVEINNIDMTTENK